MRRYRFKDRQNDIDLQANRITDSGTDRDGFTKRQDKKTDIQTESGQTKTA